MYKNDNKLNNNYNKVINQRANHSKAGAIRSKARAMASGGSADAVPPPDDAQGGVGDVAGDVATCIICDKEFPTGGNDGWGTALCKTWGLSRRDEVVFFCNEHWEEQYEKNCVGKGEDDDTIIWIDPDDTPPEGIVVPATWTGSRCEEGGCNDPCTDAICYGALSMSFCKRHYDSNWAEHPENPDNDEDTE